MALFRTRSSALGSRNGKGTFRQWRELLEKFKDILEILILSLRTVSLGIAYNRYLGKPPFS